MTQGSRITFRKVCLLILAFLILAATVLVGYRVLRVSHKEMTVEVGTAEAFQGRGSKPQAAGSPASAVPPSGIEKSFDSFRSDRASSGGLPSNGQDLLSEGDEVEGKVVFVDDEPAVGATVFWIVGEEIKATTSDKSGCFRIKGLDVRRINPGNFWIEYGGYPPWREIERRSPLLVVIPRKTIQVSGRLLDEESKRLLSYQTVIVTIGPHHFSEETDSYGAFYFDRVFPGRLFFAISAKGYLDQGNIYEIGNAQEDLHGLDLLARKGISWTITVLDPDRVPIPDALVSYSGEPLGPFSAYSTLRTDERGIAEITLPNVVGGAGHLVRIRKEGYKWFRVTLSPSRLQVIVNLVWKLEKEGRNVICGRLLDEEGKCLAKQSKVFLRKTDGAGRYGIMTRFIRKGVFSIRSLPEGFFDIWAVVEDGESAVKTVASQPEGKRETVDLIIKRYKVCCKGMVLDDQTGSSLEGVAVVLAGKGPRFSSFLAWTSEGGVFQFRYRPGRARIEFKKKGYSAKDRTVTVPGDAGVIRMMRVGSQSVGRNVFSCYLYDIDTLSPIYSASFNLVLADGSSLSFSVDEGSKIERDVTLPAGDKDIGSKEHRILVGRKWSGNSLLLHFRERTSFTLRVSGDGWRTEEIRVTTPSRDVNIFLYKR